MEDKRVGKKIQAEIENNIVRIVEQGIQDNNVEILGELIDMHKDLANEEYWKKKEEAMDMRYRGDYMREPYGRETYRREPYGRRGRDSRGRYSDGGMSYGHNGEEMMEEMIRHYEGYTEGKEQYGRGNYNAKEDTMKCLQYMLESMVDFVEMLKKEADSQEEIELIKKYTKEISEM